MNNARMKERAKAHTGTEKQIVPSDSFQNQTKFNGDDDGDY